MCCCQFVCFSQLDEETGFNTTPLYVAKNVYMSYEVSLCNTSEQSERTGCLCNLVPKTVNTSDVSSKIIS